MKEVEACMLLKLTCCPCLLDGLGIVKQPSSYLQPHVLGFQFENQLSIVQLYNTSSLFFINEKSS